MAKAQDVADFFIEVRGDNPISPVKLQMLLYLAQGHYLARYEEPLFDEDFVAYEFEDGEMECGSVS